MATLKEVAEMAGVSVSTVSYVLNGKKKVRPETLKRIEDAIDTLDYCPNLLASSLKTNRSKTIGVVASDITNLFFVDVLKNMEEELTRNGYCMILCNADNNAEKEKKSLRRLLSRNIDGLILIGTGDSDLSGYRNINLPLVCLDRVADEEFFTIRVDHVLGGCLATKYLLNKGYRKILYIGNSQYAFFRDRFQGYRQSMNEYGLSGNIKAMDLHTLKSEEAFQETKALLQKEGTFDAVFGGIDYFAIGALKALLSHGISVPEQVGVIGYDDIAPAKFTWPELTTIAQPKAEMGKNAVQYLLSMIQGEQVKERELVLKPYIIERESA
nr:LacI family DNA-binding transcriptional regulator [uncultured Schaedlerella sp.]